MLKKNDMIVLDEKHYFLKEKIGEGGAGIVWKAVNDHGKYAIKFLNKEKIPTTKLKRSEHEILFCKKFQHKNIVHIIAEGNHEKYRCYAMPFYPKTLRHVIQMEKDTIILIRYILEICKAIQYIHANEIIHRDIKPENILVNDKDLVLADFGISHFKDYSITKKGDLLANRNYSAPEQKIKNNTLKVGKEADIYALGLIINELFTKQSPSGSKFELIADSHPLFHELDDVVEGMIRQEPAQRIPIESVQAQIKFIHQKINQDIADIKKDLKTYDLPHIKINSKTLKKIYDQASRDILFGKYLFKTHSYQDIQKYNRNWHMNIGYKVSYFLFNLYIQEKILSICQAKFDYESNAFGENSWSTPLNLNDNKEHQELYKQLVKILEKYNLKNIGHRLFDLSGEILNFFSSCTDYHCQEILNQIKTIEKNAVYSLSSAPIIYIIDSLKGSIHQNMHYLLNKRMESFYFKFEEHILIDWNHTKSYEINNDENELLESHYSKEQEWVLEVLNKFNKKWKINFSELGHDYYSIKFGSYNQFKKFREYALKLAKPHYIFEGDDLHILSNPILIGNMVELRLGKIFDIPTTLAQILGLKKIYA